MDLYDEADISILTLIDDLEDGYGLRPRQAVILLREKIDLAGRLIDDLHAEDFATLATREESNDMLARALQR